MSTPPRVVDHLAAALARYHRRIGSRWRAHEPSKQAVLTCAFLEGGHTYRSLAAGNGIPRSTCYAYVQEGIKVLARRALPLTEVVRLLADLGYIGLHPQAITGYKRKRGEKALPAGKKAANVALAGLRAIGERGSAQLKQWKVLANDFRGNPRRITMIVKAVQTLQYLIRDPFGSARTVTTS